VKNPLPARQAIGRAQIDRLEQEYRPLLSEPAVSAKAQMVFGWLESILEVGSSQALWERSLGRAIEELETLRQGRRWSPKLAQSPNRCSAMVESGWSGARHLDDEL